MKKKLRDHFAKFDSYRSDISPELKEKVYALEKPEPEKPFRFSLGLTTALLLIIVAIPVGINVFNPTPSNHTPVDTDSGYDFPTVIDSKMLALSQNGNDNIARALIMAVDGYKETHQPSPQAFNRNYTINFLSNDQSTSELNEVENEYQFEYHFSFVNFYDTFEFYATIDLENNFSSQFKDTQFRVIVSNVGLYDQDENLVIEEGIIVFINQSGQIYSCLTGGTTYQPNQVILKFSNHKTLVGTDVQKDISVSPHYILTLETNYKDHLNLSLTEYESKYQHNRDEFTFKTDSSSFYKINDSILFDLYELTDRVVTVSISDHPDNFTNGQFAIEYKGKVYYCLYDEAVIENGTIEELKTSEEVTIIFDGFFVDDHLDTISAQKIILINPDQSDELPEDRETTKQTNY